MHWHHFFVSFYCYHSAKVFTFLLKAFFCCHLVGCWGEVLGAQKCHEYSVVFMKVHYVYMLLKFCVTPKDMVFAGNAGADYAVFEQGASAGNVGNTNLVEQRRANPIALLLSSAMMLRHLQFPSFADRLETAVKHVISEGKYRTKDLGGDSTTQQVVDAVIAALD